MATPPPTAARHRWTCLQTPRVNIFVQINLSFFYDIDLVSRPEVRQTAQSDGPVRSHGEMVVNIYIYLFLLFGAVFGLATFSYRHIFSEGPQQIEASAGGVSWGARLMWAMVCTFLWPIMVLTGLNSVRIMAKRKRQAVP